MTHPQEDHTDLIARLRPLVDFEHHYREDDNRYPRDFWHVRAVLGDIDTGWRRYGEQEARTQVEAEKLAAEEDALEYLALSLAPLAEALSTQERGELLELGHEVQPLYAAPVQPSPDREALARVIDPEAFASFERLMMEVDAGRYSNGEIMSDYAVISNREDAPGLLIEAYAKADAILTLLGQETGSARAGSDAHTVRPASMHSDGGEV